MVNTIPNVNPYVDPDFYRLARSRPLVPFDTGPPEHQWEGKYRLQPGDTFVEAGAFWGRYGLIASHRVGSAGRVILIEANPKSIGVIKDVVAHYKLGNVTVVHAAVWSSDGSTYFYMAGNPASNRIADASLLQNHPDECIQIKIFKLDTLLPRLGVETVDLLACDIEAAEVEMVKGSEKYFKEKRIKHVALAAYHKAGFPEQIMEILSGHGYEDLIYSYSMPQYGGIVYGRSPDWAEEYDPEELEKIEERLRALGYIE